MKKLLLSLFCLLAVGATTFTAHAEEQLATTLAFDSWDNQTDKISSYEKTWDCYYNSQVWSIENFNNNNQGWTSIKCGRKSNTSVAAIATKFPISNNLSKINLSIKSLTASNAKKVNSIKLYLSTDGSNWSDTGLTFTASQGVQTVEIPEDKQISDAYAKIEFDLNSTANGFLEVDKVEYYSTEANLDPTTMSMSAQDLSIAFHETKVLDNITFRPEISTGDLYELNFSGDFGDGLSFEKNADGEYTVFGNKTGTYNVNVDFNGLGGSVEGKTGSASFDVTVGRDPSTFAEYTLVTDLDQIGESANILIAYASGTTADLMGSTIKSGYVERTEADSFYDSTKKSFKEDESYSPFIIEVNPDVPGEYRINIGTKANPVYLNCDANTTSSTNLTSTTATNASNGYWTLSVAANGSATLKRGSNTLRCNTGTNPHRFKTYSGTTGSLPQIYVDKSSVVLPDPYTQKVTSTTDIENLAFHGVTTVTRPVFKVAPANYDSYTLEYICDTPGVAGFSLTEGEMDSEQYSNSITITDVKTPVYVKGLRSKGVSTITAKFTGTFEGKTYTAEAKFNITIDEDPLPAEANIEAEDVTVEVGKSQTLHFDVDPNFPTEPGENDTIEFVCTSDNFTFDQETLTVTGVKEGEGTITIKVHMFVGPDKCHEYQVEKTINVYVKPETPHYTLVTDIAQLGQEAKVYVVSAEARKIMGAQNGTYREAADLDEADITDQNTLIFFDENYVEFTVAKKPHTKIEEGVGQFSLYDNTSEKKGYLNSTARNQLSTVENPSYFTLSIAENGDAKIIFSDEAAPVKYYTTSNRFNTYAATTSQYKPVQLFVRAKSVVPVDEYEMNISAKDLEIKYHETVNLDNITYAPAIENYENVEIEYVVTNEGVVEIDQTAEVHTLKGIKSQGVTDVTVNFKGYRGEKEYTHSATFNVKVGKDPLPENATIEVAENIVVEIGEEPVDMKLNITPDVTEEEYTITYDAEAIKIENGLIYGLKEGETEVTITLDAKRGDEGEHHYTDTYTFTVTVLPAPARYIKVTDRKQLGKEATVIIVANTAGRVMSTTQNSNNRGSVEVSGLSASTESIKHQNDFAVITMTKQNDGTFTLYDAAQEGYLQSSTSANRLNISTTPVYAEVSFENGNAVIKFNGDRTIRNNGSLFSTYSTGQTAVQLYMIPQEIEIPAVTLSWSDLLDQPIEDGAYTTTADIEYLNGNYSLADITLQLNASDENFPFDKVTVTAKSNSTTNPGTCQWVDNTFEYEKPGKYTLTVAPKAGYDLSEDWDVTFPESLIVTINKIDPKFGNFGENLVINHQAAYYTPEFIEIDGKKKEVVGTHQINDYELDLEEGDLFFRDDLDHFMDATLIPLFDNEWEKKVNAGEIDLEQPNHHKMYSHLYYEHPEDLIILSNALDFEGAMAPGKYTLKIEVVNNKDWFTQTSSENTIIIKPNVEALDITRMKKTDDGFTFGYHEEDFMDESGNVVNEPKDNNHEYYAECQFVRAHGGDIWYKVARESAVVYGPAYLGAENSTITDMTDEDLTNSGYEKAEFDPNKPAYSTPIDLRGATGIDIVEDVNGVRSQASGIRFNSNIETFIKEISAIEVEEGETLYFTLDGILVTTDRLAPGIYIRRTAREASVIMIR